MKGDGWSLFPQITSPIQLGWDLALAIRRHPPRWGLSQHLLGNMSLGATVLLLFSLRGGLGYSCPGWGQFGGGMGTSHLTASMRLLIFSPNGIFTP